MAASFLPEDEGAPGACGNLAVISAGTGLDEAGLYWDKKQHHPFASEDGHYDFAPGMSGARTRICSRATEEGRVTLSEMRFITTTEDGGRRARVLTSEEEYQTIPSEHFGILRTRDAAQFILVCTNGD